MSPTLQSIIIPTAMLSITSASFYFCVGLAKKRVPVWKRNATFWFCRSVSLTGLEKRAKKIWMEKLGYNEADALIISDYQSLAYFLIGLGNVTLLVGAFFFLSER